MKRKKFIVVLTRDEEQPDIFNVDVPELPGCFTWGFGKSEAIENAKEAIGVYLKSMSSSARKIVENAESVSALVEA